MKGFKTAGHLSRAATVAALAIVLAAGPAYAQSQAAKTGIGRSVAGTTSGQGGAAGQAVRRPIGALTTGAVATGLLGAVIIGVAIAIAGGSGGTSPTSTN